MNKNSSILLWMSLAVCLCACDKNDAAENSVREEYVKVYETSPDKLVDNIQIPFEGVSDGKIHVISNVDLQWKYLVDPSQTDTGWLTVKSVEEVAPGHTVVTYDAESILDHNSLERRKGELSFTCPSAFFGKFLTVSQGYERVFLQEFTDEPGGAVRITGQQIYTTEEYPLLSTDYYDYISFNVWAETKNEYLGKNITLDITVSGGRFYDTGLTTYRVNVPVGTAPEESNLKYLLIMGNDGRMSASTTFTFSAANDDLVYVHVDNLAAYTVSEAEMGFVFDDEDYNEEEDIDWI